MSGLEFSWVAAFLGFLMGVVGFVPLFFAMRSITPALRGGAAAIGLLGVGLSLIMMLAAVLVCYKLAPGAVACFGICIVVAFLAATGVYSFRYYRRIR